MSLEQLNTNKLDAPRWLVVSGLLFFVTGMLFGTAGSFQYIFPGLLKQHLSFERMRPLHVSSVIFWILFTSTGSVLVYLRGYTKEKLFASWLTPGQLSLFVLAAVLILSSYVMGVFGGREYWEFPPPLALFFAGGWILFIVQVVGSVKTLKRQPVYIWMWLTGALGFLLTFSESYLWVFAFFKNDIVRDMTVQWKSYGSMVGCWNMLVYGLGMFLMEKIGGDKAYARSRMAFGLFFLGLFNLMFNWSHHIYTLPVHPGIRNIGYLVSMTELFILGRIIYKWRESVSAARKQVHSISYRFLMIADFWIFFNLIVAILISVPAINVFTHGTHITVAHVMGTTIGINTMLLLAAAFDLLQDTCFGMEPYRRTIFRAGWLVNGSLLVFLIALARAGIERARWQMSAERVPFGEMMNELTPFFIVFAIAGLLLFVGFTIIVYPLVRNTVVCSVKQFLLKRKQWRVLAPNTHDHTNKKFSI